MQGSHPLWVMDGLLKGHFGLVVSGLHRFPDYLGTTTMPAHDGVGSLPFEMTPAFSIVSSSSLTLGYVSGGE